MRKTHMQTAYIFTFLFIRTRSSKKSVAGIFLAVFQSGIVPFPHFRCCAALVRIKWWTAIIIVIATFFSFVSDKKKRRIYYCSGSNKFFFFFPIWQVCFFTYRRILLVAHSGIFCVHLNRCVCLFVYSRLLLIENIFPKMRNKKWIVNNFA